MAHLKVHDFGDPGKTSAMQPALTCGSFLFLCLRAALKQPQYEADDADGNQSVDDRCMLLLRHLMQYGIGILKVINQHIEAVVEKMGEYGYP